ncbi:MAG: hypothetical protein ACR2FS_07745 [Phormidesmis sp.]
MALTAAWLKDSAHRKWKDRQFYLKLSTGRTEAALIANELPILSGYAPVSFTITTDGQLEAAAPPLPIRWVMPLQTFAFTAAGQSLQYESAFIMAGFETVAAGGFLADYVVFDSTQTILDGQSSTITLQWAEFDGAPYVA